MLDVFWASRSIWLSSVVKQKGQPGLQLVELLSAWNKWSFKKFFK